MLRKKNNHFINEKERQILKEMTLSGKLKAHKFQRALILLAADIGFNDQQIMSALNVNHSYIKHIRKCYVQSGLEHAMNDDFCSDFKFTLENQAEPQISTTAWKTLSDEQRCCNFPPESDETIQPKGPTAYFQYICSSFIKRTFDIIFSALSLIILSPIFALIANRIKRDSAGPVLFRGIRVGRGGEPFTIFKFRTMVESPQSYQGPPITSNNDERVTPIGRWLRATKLNELPQLWNVLVGEMSLVGPRPEDPKFVAEWPDDVCHKLLSVRPGITSPASVLYRDEEQRLNGSLFINDYLKEILPDKLRLDQLYVNNHSFLKDLDVIFLTVLAILPRIGKVNIREETVFSGPFYRFYTRHFRWFLIDFLVAFIAVGFAGLFWRLSQPLNIGLESSILLALVIALIISLVSTLFGLHTIIWRYASPALVIDIALSLLIASVILILADIFVLEDINLEPIFVLSFVLLTMIGMIAVRYRERLLTGIANRWTHWRHNQKSFSERVLVVGAGDGGELAVWLIHKSKFAAAFSILGFVDDDYSLHNYSVAGLPVLGSTWDIPKLVKENDVGLILYTISKISLSQRNRILDMCKGTGVRIIAVPDLLSILRDPLQGNFIKEIK